MDGHIHINILVFLTALATVFLLLLTTLPHSHCQSGQQETKFSVCGQPFNCGSLSDISYPFWRDNRPSYCGIFKLNCGPGQYASIEIDSQIFEVGNIDAADSTITLVRQKPINDACSQHLTNISLSPLFSYKEPVHNITIFHDCPSGVPIGVNNFTCQNNGTLNALYSEVNQTVLHEFPGLNACESRTLIQAPVDYGGGGDEGFATLKDALNGAFDVKYFTGGDECIRCEASGGICGTIGASEDQFSCFCPDTADECRSIYQVVTVADNPYFWRRKPVILGVTSAAIAGLLISITFCYFKCKPSKWQAKFWLMTKGNRDIEAFLKNHGAIQSRRYKFSDVKKMTNSFKIKLGQGGFGAVYRGKLPTGCHVAVKILNESKGNGEDFINEVVSISRTSHVNVVTLLGFCLEGKKKALIYEFMSNGSLEKFIFKNESQTTTSLSWEKMYQIAIGIARGLEYLHRGCNTRILHFDIKPHNILLDDNFCPKISDFGLAKLCPKKESIISMSNARGTIGYVAPEVWNRHLGGVSHKSDVYSYGMMLLEMVGGRKNINPEASHTSKIYFPHWAYKRLEIDVNIGTDGVIAQEENEIAKKMTVVGFWCIQTIPSCRPTIGRVIDMLEGSMGSLEMPPKPVFSSLLQDQQQNPPLLQD